MTADLGVASFLPPLNKVVKELKREESSLFNCISSILADTSFVHQIAGLYPSLPLYANLRCGRWYTPRPDGTCYFKSTDGHFGEWSFSTTRLNWHIALAAAAKGGCIIVDATRRGKTFPDALTKTIPIWAAVINRAIRIHREHINSRPGCILPPDAASSADALSLDFGGSRNEGSKLTSERDWDEGVHLPAWISNTEEAQIQARLQIWAHELQQAGVALDKLSDTLKKPLRPLWISQNSRIWLNDIQSPEDMPFTPLFLVSASTPNARQRHSHSATCSPAASQGADDPDGNSAPMEISFSYVPGAGDDEESWARGLTPEVFWQNKEILLRAGPDGVLTAVRGLLKQEPGKAQMSKPAADPAVVIGHTAGTCAGFLRFMPLDLQAKADPLNKRVLVTARPAGRKGTRKGTAQHFLPVLGCRTSEIASTPFTPDLPCFVGNTGLALGSNAAALSAGVWLHVDAVLNVGLEGLQQAGGTTEKYLHLPVKSSKFDRHALYNSLPPALAFITSHLSSNDRVLVHCKEGTDQSVCVVLAVLLCCFTVTNSAGDCQFVGDIAQCDSADSPSPSLHGGDAAIPSAEREGGIKGSEDAVREGTDMLDMSTLSSDQRHECSSLQTDHAVCEGQERRGSLISKAFMRQRLALISSCYPVANPSRGNMKQVFNFARQYWTDR